jgi:hypothetical protein
MTDIEVGSLWLCDDEPLKVVCVTENVYTEELDDGSGYCWSSKQDFLNNCTPYTPPKEYKVWVYETFCGRTYAYPYQETNYANIGLTLKAIITGKEGDGL